MNNSVIDVIGNTPLIRLKRVSELTGCESSGQGGVHEPPASRWKDRAALFIIRDAEKKGLLRPGGVIVERHGRQYGHRADGGRQGARLPHP